SDHWWPLLSLRSAATCGTGTGEHSSQADSAGSIPVTRSTRNAPGQDADPDLGRRRSSGPGPSVVPAYGQADRCTGHDRRPYSSHRDRSRSPGVVLAGRMPSTELEEDDTMTDGGPAEATPGARDDAAGGDTADERFAAIMRAPRRGALISGALVPLTAAVNLLLEDMSGLLFAGTVISAFVCALALWNVVNFSPRAITRLEALAPRVNGRFTLWKAGTGGLAGVPFAYGV